MTPSTADGSAAQPGSPVWRSKKPAAAVEPRQPSAAVAGDEERDQAGDHERRDGRADRLARRRAARRLVAGGALSQRRSAAASASAAVESVAVKAGIRIRVMCQAPSSLVSRQASPSSHITN